MWRNSAELQRAIRDAPAKYVGRFLVISQVRELNIDGFLDSLELVMATDDLALARERMGATNGALWDQSRSATEWKVEATYTLPAEIDPSVEGVRLVAQVGGKVKDDAGFNADTRAVQLLEVDERPTIGEPLFRALRYAPELRISCWPHPGARGSECRGRTFGRSSHGEPHTMTKSCP